MNTVDSNGAFPGQDLRVSHGQQRGMDPVEFAAEQTEIRLRVERVLAQELTSEQLRELGIMLQAQTEAVLWGLTELKRMGHRS